MDNESTASLLRLELNVLPAVNYALEQNGVPILRSLVIVNDSDIAYEHVDLRFTTRPMLCVPMSRHIDYLPAHSAFEVKDAVLRPNASYFAGLTERESGLLSVRLFQGETELCAAETELIALAFDQWHGSAFCPELLCAFVAPNHPALVPLLSRASELLENWTGSPSLDAYQSRDPNRVLRQAAALYGALQEQNIVYAVPPASFEQAGQRVRLCDELLRQKLGTCLDLTLCYAALLEAAGLHPLMVLKDGHIFAGVWLEDLSFPEAVQDDVSLVSKRLADGIDQIAVTECTALTSGKTISFDEAGELARKALTAEDLICVIDVHRARLSGVRPLPLRVMTEDGWRVERENRSEEELTAAPKELAAPVAAEAEETPATRKSRWERKLLDLGLRNALINLRPSRTLVPLLSPSVDELEDALSDGADFSVQPKPTDWKAESEDAFEAMTAVSEAAPLLRSEFKNHRLRSILTDAELAKNIKELYRAAKLSLEESGANTLYLALGLLRWYETPRSPKPRYAPLVLLPVEMVRKSAAEGYVIRLRDDEPQMNISLLEKLQMDFDITVGGLDPLPPDEHGVDMRAVFTVMRKAVMEQKSWDVLETACLGIFSFSQFVMWNDIRARSEELARNKVVRSLMDGKLAWEAEDMSPGERVPEDGVFLPLSADASQLYAIEAATAGESFVLHGPPGTGKSQTITALIANALAQGRTVLFVAEKMAALEVVEKRLDDIGIGAFCLELHSNKSKKRDVLEQLRQASEITKIQSAAVYEQKGDQIAALRAELDAYAEALHRVQPCGRTLYQLIEQYESERSAPELPPLSPAMLSAATAETLDAQASAVQRAVAAGRAVGHPQNHPLSFVHATEYSQQLRMSLPAAAKGYRAALLSLRDALEAFCAPAGLPCGSGAEIDRACALAAELPVWAELPAPWASAENLNVALYGVRDLCAHYEKANALFASLSTVWRPELFAQNGAALAAEYAEADGKWALARTLALNTLTKKLAPYALGAVPKDGLGEHLNTLVAAQAELAEAQRLLGIQGGSLGAFYRGEATDWAGISALTDKALTGAERLRALTGSDAFRLRCAGNRELDAPARELCAAKRELDEAKKAFYELLDIRGDTGADWLARQEAMCAAATERMGELREWIAWNAAASEAESLGLTPVIAAYAAGMAHDDVLPAYRRAAAMGLAVLAIDASPALSRFSGPTFNEKIAQLRALDRELTTLTRREIFCRLAARVPNFAKEAAQSSELGILQKAIRSGGRGVSIRALFEQLPNLLPRLCPCMLMSPLSAAQYLDPKREPFDLVVFDEASQLPTCKAVGALARGKNAVVVGDPKQMPPTSFFSVNAVDEENLDIEDLESILDDCLALGMPQTHLLWHYRSRHESLIAFSNRQFYENKLYTFPSVNDRERKVRLVPVEGVFERGKTRQNRAEAEAVVAELSRRAHDPAEASYSVGVVTFNINQQNLIDDLLTDACRADPALEAWAYGAAEPLFIKNLENVQGDERDVILFSVGYGPDEAGKVSMNFGPLNRDGGWRRLNVAVTRARREMTVFSTLKPEQIDLNRSSADGVAALRAFLEYAEGRSLAYDDGSARASMDARSAVADAICDALREKGWETARSVGHSAYRIDIGVVDPDDSERYLLGVMLDGGSYAAAKTTRDREIAQASVLEGLGWRLTRVWSMDWWDNRQRELDHLLRELETARAERAATVQAAAEAPLAASDSAEEKSASDASEAQTPAQRGEPSIVARLRATIANAPSKKSELSKISVYRAARLPSETLTPEELVQDARLQELYSRMRSVLAAEAPVSEALLLRRVVQSYGIARSGSRIQSHLAALLDSMRLTETSQDGQRFFWAEGQDPDRYARLRANGEGDDRRDARDVSVQEAANAVVCALCEQVSLPREDLIREAARLMGFTRLGGNVSSLFDAAAAYAAERGWIAAGGSACTLTAGGQAWYDALGT